MTHGLVSTLTALSIFLLASGPAQSEEPQEFYVGEQAGFEGVFCRNEAAADFVFGADSEQDMLMRFNIHGLCVRHGAPIEVLGLHKTYEIEGNVWNLIQVKTPDQMIHFIVTQMPVYSGEAA